MVNFPAGSWGDETCFDAAEGFAEYAETSLADNLGAGVDGVVFTTSRPSAVKSLKTDSLFEREAEVYFRLADAGLTVVDGFNVPEMRCALPEFRAIELSIVRPPFVLDFATVALDRPPEWDEERAEAFDASIDEFFGDEADAVRSVIASFSRWACS